jgi:hypothetical protein
MTPPNEQLTGETGGLLAVGYGDLAWADLEGQTIDGNGRIERAVLLPMGTRAGNASVEILVRMPDGSLIHANTTWLLWSNATELMSAWRKNPDL